MSNKKRVRGEYGRRKSLEYYHRNRAACLRKMKKWQKDNPALYAECRRKSRSKNAVKSLLECIRYRAKRQGVGFDLTEDWWLAHFSQGCAATGLDLDAPVVGSGAGRSGGPWSPHVDRIRVGGDYTMDNCRIVCGLYNMARRNWSDADVLKMATALVERRGSMQNG